jgi:hypothetical protein
MSLAKLKAYGQLVAAFLVAFLGLSVGATAIGHAIDPDHIGLWSGDNAFFFGAVYGRLDGMFRAHQLPGSTLYIVTVMVVGICFFVTRELYGFARAGLKRRAD